MYGEIPWRFHVRLLDDGRVVDDQSPFSAACGQAEPTDVANVPGADPEAPAWRTTYGDHCEVLLAARSVAPAPGISALLVTQQTGQESIYQLHWLFVEQNGKLDTPWSSPTGPGHASRVRVLPGAAQQNNDVAFIDASSPSDDEPSTLAASRLHFDGARGLTTTRLPDARTPLFVMSLGGYKTVDAALKAWGGYRPCSFQYRVFKANLFPEARARGFLLATVLAQRNDVKAEEAALSTCTGIPKPSIFESHASW